MKNLFIILTVINASILLGAEYTIISKPSLVTQVVSISTSTRLWDFPDNASEKDGTYAQTLLRLNTITTESAILNFASFDFSSIPLNATITGLQVTITRRTLGGTSLSDKLVQLTLGGENKAKVNEEWSESWDDITYGGQNDLWGSFFTLSQLQTIGVNVQVGRRTNAGTANQFPQIDGLTLAISYTTPLPIDLIEFKGRFLSRQQTEVDWSTATEINNSHFILDRSWDGVNFDNLDVINGAGYSQNRIDYRYLDDLDKQQDFVYYRIQQVDFNGDDEIYGPITVRKVEFALLTIYPNPVTDFLFIETTNSNPLSELKMTDYTGKSVRDESFLLPSNLTILDLRNLQSGAYFLELNFKDGTSQKRNIVRL